MTDIHVDDFFKDGAKVLTQLYGVFPRRHSVFVEDICGPDEPDEFGMHSQRHLSCFGTMLWLGEEGYLRYEDTIRQEAIDQAVLSARCFTLLSTPDVGTDVQGTAAVPPSVQAEQSTTIHRLRWALKQRSSAAIRIIMVELMAHMNGHQPR